jgi:hypothetical protein
MGVPVATTPVRPPSDPRQPPCTPHQPCMTGHQPRSPARLPTVVPYRSLPRAGTCWPQASCRWFTSGLQFGFRDSGCSTGLFLHLPSRFAIEGFSQTACSRRTCEFEVWPEQCLRLSPVDAAFAAPPSPDGRFAAVVDVGYRTRARSGTCLPQKRKLASQPVASE